MWKPSSSSSSLIPWPSYRLLKATLAFQLFSYPAIPILFTSKSSKNVLQPGPCLISSILYAGPSRYYCWQEISAPSTSAVCYSYPPYRYSAEVCHTDFLLCFKLPSSFQAKSEKKYISVNMFLGLSMWVCIHIEKPYTRALPHLALWPMSNHAFCDCLLIHCLQSLSSEVEGP